MSGTKTCIVSFECNGKWMHVTAASSLFEAGRIAWDWFQDSFWKGPRPTRDTIFEVAVTSLGEYRRYRVKASSFLPAEEKPGS